MYLSLCDGAGSSCGGELEILGMLWVGGAGAVCYLDFARTIAMLQHAERTGYVRTTNF